MPSTTPRCQIRLLGQTAVGAEADRRIGGRPQRTLLSLLSLFPGSAVSFDQLVEWTWGHRLPDNPRAALQTRVSRLRQALGASRDVLETLGDAYRLDVARRDVDTHLFEELVADGASRHDLEAAAELWIGAPFADAESLDVLHDESMRLARVWLGAQQRLVEAQMHDGDVGQAAATCERAMRHDPFDEGLMAARLRIAAADGTGPATVERFERWRERYRQLFDVAPPDYLAELADRLRAPSATPVAVAATAPSTPSTPGSTPPSSPAPWTIDLDRTPLVGRSHRRAAESDAPITIAVAPSGFGRTTVAAHWLGTQRRLGRATVALEPNDATASTIEQALSGHTATEPVAIVIDDAHRVGRDTDGALVPLIARITGEARARCLLAVAPGPQLGGWGELTRRPDTCVVELEALQVGDVNELLADRGLPAGDGLAAELHAMTLGHPFATGLLARELAGTASDRPSERIDPVANVLAAVLPRPDGDVRDALVLAAIAHQPMLGGDVERLVGAAASRHTDASGGHDGADLLSRLLDTGFVQRTPRGELQVAPVMRRYVQLHHGEAVQRWAATLEDEHRAAGDLVAAVRYRGMMPGPVGHPDLIRLVSALERLLAAGSFDDALAIAQPLVARIGRTDADAPERARVVARSHYLAARAATLGARRDDADRHLDEAMAIGMQADLADVVVDAALGHRELGRPHADAAAASRTRVARVWTDRHGTDHDSVRLRLEQLRCDYSTGRPISPDVVDELNEQCRDAPPATRADAAALAVLAVAGAPVATVRAALERWGDTAQQLERDVEPPFATIGLVQVRIGVAARSGDPTSAAELLDWYDALALRYANTRHQFFAAAARASLAMECGDEWGWRRAVAHMAEIGNRAGFPDAAALHFAHAVHALERGWEPPAGPPGEIAAGRLDADLATHPAVRLGQAWVGAAADPDAARAELLDVWPLFVRSGLNGFTLAGGVFAARCEQRVGPTPLAPEIARMLEPYAGERAFLGTALVALGDVPDPRAPTASTITPG